VSDKDIYERPEHVSDTMFARSIAAEMLPKRHLASQAHISPVLVRKREREWTCHKYLTLFCLSSCPDRFGKFAFENPGVAPAHTR